LNKCKNGCPDEQTRWGMRIKWKKIGELCVSENAHRTSSFVRRDNVNLDNCITECFEQEYCWKTCAKKNCRKIETLCQEEGGVLASRRTVHMWLAAGGDRKGLRFGLTSTKDPLGNPWLTIDDGDFGFKLTGFDGCTSESWFFLCEAPIQEPACSAIAYQEGKLQRYHLGATEPVLRPADRQDWKRVSDHFDLPGEESFVRKRDESGQFSAFSDPAKDPQLTLALRVIPGYESEAEPCSVRVCAGEHWDLGSKHSSPGTDYCEEFGAGFHDLTTAKREVKNETSGYSRSVASFAYGGYADPRTLHSCFVPFSCVNRPNSTNKMKAKCEQQSRGEITQEACNDLCTRGVSSSSDKVCRNTYVPIVNITVQAKCVPRFGSPEDCPKA